ncbi:protein jagged-1-like [Centruroides vittatus]|uniref:protein jagged-1-like n=1 Tax=Centruroides vittatus TaxID=120091 RepID=UPI00350FC0C0
MPEEGQTTGPEEEVIQTTGPEVISTSEPNDDACNPNPCQNGGICKINKHERFECKCPKGTKGKRCERVDWCKVLRDDGTTGKSYCNRGEAKCVSQRDGNFSCKCYNRKKEFNYEIGKCKSRDMCSPNPCQHGGICSTSGNQAHCECPEGAYGRYCERVNWCFIKMENGKSGADYCDQGEAKCVENRRMQNFTCVCYNKRKTFNEELHECIDESYETEVKAAEALTECEQDTTGYDECRDKDALCFKDPYSYLGYICVCKDGTKLEEGTCETNENPSEVCSEDSVGYKHCHKVSAECFVNPKESRGYSCLCPNGAEYNEITGCELSIAYASELKCSDGNCENDDNNAGSSNVFLVLIISMSANILLVFGVIAVVSYKRIRKMKKDPLIPVEN